MKLTDDDIKRALDLCERKFGDGKPVPDPEEVQFAIGLLPAALAELQRWRPFIERAKDWHEAYTTGPASQWEYQEKRRRLAMSNAMPDDD